MGGGEGLGVVWFCCLGSFIGSSVAGWFVGVLVGWEIDTVGSI